MLEVTSVRLSRQMLNDLRELAKAETDRRGEVVSPGQLLREGARRMVRQARRRAAAAAPAGR